MNYSKEETLHYTYLLMEAKNKFNTQLWPSLQEDFDTIEFIDCFNSIGIQHNSIFPVRIKTKPCLAILKRKVKEVKLEKRKERLKKVEKISALNEEVMIKKPNKKKKSSETIEEKKFIKDELKASTTQLFKINTTTLETNEMLTSPLQDSEIITSQDNLQAPQLLSRGSDVEEDAVVSTIESTEDTNDTAAQINKEINFQELHNLALGSVNRKTRATKLKIRRIIEQYYRDKGKHIENDSKEKKVSNAHSAISSRQTVKTIIKQERIKEMIEQISAMDLTKVCDLEKVSTKDCLKLVIDKLDEAGRHVPNST